MNRTLRPVAVFSLLAGGLLTCLSLAPASAQSDHPLPTKVETFRDSLIDPAQRKAAPELLMPDSDGHTVQLAALRGKVVLLDFWATWCGGCKFELPYFVKFDQSYRSAGLRSIGISMDDAGMPVVKSFLKEKSIPYPSIIGNDSVAAAYHLGAMPMTVLIDKKGRIALSHSGVVDRDNFEEHVRALLAEDK